MKITVVGAGNVGATLAQRFIEKDFADIVLVDVVEGIPQGKALDLRQSANIVGFKHSITGSNGYDQTAGSDIIVITAGIGRKPGMTRDDLIGINAKVVREVVEKTVKISPHSIFIIVTNPVDTMTYLALRVSGFPRQRVFGLSGVLDGARLAGFIADELKLKATDIVPCVMGEHGSNMVIYPRFTMINDRPLVDLVSEDTVKDLVKRTVNGGAEVVALLKTGGAFYAPSASILKMATSIIGNKGDTMNCAVYLNGEYGLRDVVLGVPVTLGKSGIGEIIELPLDGNELNQLHASAEAVKKTIAVLNL